MTNQTQHDTSIGARTVYTYEVPDIAIEAARLFLRRSQEVASKPVSEAVAEYQWKVRSGEPYGDAMNVKEFRERYLS
jgi:hypothetical protein